MTDYSARLHIKSTKSKTNKKIMRLCLNLSKGVSAMIKFVQTKVKQLKKFQIMKQVQQKLACF